MRRRKFLQSTLVGAFGVASLARPSDGALSDMKIKRVRIYNPTDRSGTSGWLNHSAIIVTAETAT